MKTDDENIYLVSQNERYHLKESEQDIIYGNIISEDDLKKNNWKWESN